MYFCVSCGTRIDTPSHTAKCIDCALKPRREKEAIEEKERLEMLAREAEFKRQEKEREYAEATFTGVARYLKETNLDNVFHHMQRLGIKINKYPKPSEVDLNGTSSSGTINDYLIELSQKRNVPILALVTRFGLRHNEYGWLENTVSFVYGLESNPKVRELAKTLVDQEKERLKREIQRQLKEEAEKKAKARYNSYAKQKLPNQINILDSIHRHRETVCWSCFDALSTKTHLLCSKCHWIKCGNCGACGCKHVKYIDRFAF